MESTEIYSNCTQALTEPKYINMHKDLKKVQELIEEERKYEIIAEVDNKGIFIKFENEPPMYIPKQDADKKNILLLTILVLVGYAFLMYKTT